MDSIIKSAKRSIRIRMRLHARSVSITVVSQRSANIAPKVQRPLAVRVPEEIRAEAFQLVYPVDLSEDTRNALNLRLLSISFNLKSVKLLSH
jgi:hypothetical protein